MKKLILILLTLALGMKSYAQDKKTVGDSIAQDSVVQKIRVQDSLILYQNIKNYSKKRKFTKMVHKWIFRHTKRKSRNEEDQQNLPDYIPHAGKVIRNIVIRSHDPFGYSPNDTMPDPRNWFEKTGNNIHVKTNDGTVKKFILFNEGETIDTLLIQETARLLRKQNYIRKVRIIPKPIEGSKDSLDLVVEVLDSWSLIPKGSFSGTRTKLGLRERNFAGTGHRVSMKYSKRLSDGSTGFETVYTVPNIQNTFIDITGKYAFDLNQYYDHFVAINREFYSPLARWAGGAFVQERFLGRPFPKDSSVYTNQDFKYLYQNYWGAYAFPLLKGNSEEERTTNLVVGLRSFFLNYSEGPAVAYDSIRYFSDERFYLASVGISSRQFVKDHYIFRDGETEDVPIGTLFSLTAGVQRKNQRNRLYSGLRASYGDYSNWGFLSANFELGTFFNGSRKEQTTLSLKANYFSNLLDLGRGWKMRQFVKPQLVLGFNRLDSEIDRIGLNENPYFKGVNSYGYLNYGRRYKYIDYDNGNIHGFESLANGTRKYMVDLQTQFYSPWNFWGFRFNPFVHASFGVLAGYDNSYANNEIFSSFGAGIIIRNDYLVFDSFQISFSYYPTMPGEGNNIINTNSFRREDFGFQDFRLGEPQQVIFE
ncbi:MAG: hypothetical protein ACTH6S_02220 [Mesonia sp.]|uniref:hypothetical protein n=1 Tax=Mesonia sp. TaxID=1960830 RepID=UPI003F97668A